jgi:hypothetical protein
MQAKRVRPHGCRVEVVHPHQSSFTLLQLLGSTHNSTAHSFDFRCARQGLPAIVDHAFCFYILGNTIVEGSNVKNLYFFKGLKYNSIQADFHGMLF